MNLSRENFVSNKNSIEAMFQMQTYKILKNSLSFMQNPL